MASDGLEDVEENIRLLIREELETQHWLEGHEQPMAECPVCRAHNTAA